MSKGGAEWDCNIPTAHLGHFIGSRPVIVRHTSRAHKPESEGRYEAAAMRSKQMPRLSFMLRKAKKPKYRILQKPPGKTCCKNRLMNSFASRSMCLRIPAAL